jgi:acyl-CoA thioesterase-2
VPASALELVELLDLEVLDVDLYRGRQPQTDRQRVFGGQVAAQALLAGIRTVDASYVVHSLHSYFLRPGDTAVPIVYDVERLRDGRSFATRRVVARQHGRPIYFQTANFQRSEDGLDHQDAMPETIPPEEGYDLVELIRMRSEEQAAAFAQEWAALDIRYVGTSALGLHPDPMHPARARAWVRVNGRLSEDPFEHLAAFTYASDLTLLGATLVPHGVDLSSPGLQPASLDHTIWFHRPFRADDWWLYDQWSPSASGGRGLALARVFTQDGRLVATVAQEGLIRLHDDVAPGPDGPRAG